MAHTAGCTIVAKNTLSYARVLARSFRRCHPDIPFFVLLADDVQGCFDPAGEPCSLVRLTQLRLPHLERFRFRHPQQPFSYACTPFLIAWLLEQGIERGVYFKQETLVLDDLSPLFERLGESPLVMTPHLIEPLSGPDAAGRELNILQSGVYNVGVLGVGRHPTSDRFLSWWQDRLLTHCRLDVEAGLHYEQRWLDLVPGFFDGVHVLRDPAYNIGHWSLPERRLEVGPDGGVLVDGRRCRVVRFSGYRPDDPMRITGYNTRLSWEEVGPVRQVFERFGQALDHEGYRETRAWPYAYGEFDNGVAVPDLARRLYLDLGSDVDAFGDPLHTAPAGSYWRWLNAVAADTGLPRFWHAIYRARPDLQQAYPVLDRPGRAAFAEWARRCGVAEYQASDRWLDSLAS